MATLFQLPRTAPLYAGSSLASSKLYFFQSGTLTPITTYTTSALSVAHTHPVVADGEGVFPAIFLNPTVNATYRVQLKTLADVLKYDEDNLQTAQESVDVQWTFNAQVKGTYSSDATGAAFLAQSLIPAYRWYRSAAATNEKVWEARANISSWTLCTLDDSSGFVENAILATRSAGVVTSVSLYSANAVAVKADNSTTATHTRLLVYDVDNATLERVTVGAADSGGSGYKVLRIPN